MNLNIPGLGGALEKLDHTSEQMTQLVAGINQVIALLTEQNRILSEQQNGETR